MEPAASERPGAGRGYRVVGLIGLAHGCSHFSQLVLPPLFPLLRETFGVNYTQLGAMMALFYTASGLAQTPAGFLVDRIGARPVLFAGLGLLGGSVVLFALAPSFWLLLPLVVAAGLGNSVFHPADYAILTASVHRTRLGRAYGVHTLGGNIGWAIAPIFMLGLTAEIGWRPTVMLAGGVGLAALALLATHASALAGDTRPARAGALPHPARRSNPLGTLLSTPILLCFGYFVALAIATIGVQTFLPPTLGGLYGTDLATAGSALTGFLLGASLGVVVGGFVADRIARHELVVAFGLGAAACLVLVVASVDLPAVPLIALMALAGFFVGLTTPSRDLLVRGATPPGAAGKVFGFVYSGLDAGSAVAPVVMGVMLDRGHPGQTLWFVALVLVLAVLSAAAVKRLSRPRRPLPAE